MKRILKSIVPRAWVSYVKDRKDGFLTSKIAEDWAKVAGGSFEAINVSHPVRKVLLVPTDPSHLIGSLGDAAMISAAVSQVKQANASCAIDILTADVGANEIAKENGWRPQEIWYKNDFVGAIVNLIRTERYDAVLALGADVVDGYYGGVMAAKILIACDIASRFGIPTSLLGFSFNESPVEELRPIFNGLHSGVKVNVREKNSFNRLGKFSHSSKNLVADSAFLLDPLPHNVVVKEIADWVQQRRVESKVIIGFNIHPMLIKNATPSEVDRLVGAAAGAIRAISEKRSVAWILIPHDYREGCGDLECLSELWNRIKDLSPEVYLVSGRLPPGALKAIAGLLDGVVSGRMHLAIGSLGMEVPVLAITYQDKFEGLFDHFSFPNSLMISPQEFINPDIVLARLLAFVDGLSNLRTVVETRLPKVLNAARQNFSILTSSAEE